jgi:homoserine O-acetyltransferase/O-succinyltransferase
MNKLALLLLFISPAIRAQETREPGPAKPEQHEFVIANFKTESGVTLPQARVVYGTYGELNSAKDNVVLLPSHYMADLHGYEWLIGPEGSGKALDPSKLFLVATELFGNGRSSSPSNTPEPFHGPRFPVTTIRDNVEAVHRLLTEELHVSHLRAIIGFSMGAQQAFQWAVSYPDFADRVVATAGTAKCWPHGIVRLESEIAAITTDAAFNNGNYTEQPKKGIETFAIVWEAWLFSQEWWRKELWREGAKPGTTFESFVNDLRSNFIPGADANNLILQMRTWEKHDVGTTPGFGGDTEKALRSIKTPFLYMPSETDLYFPVSDAHHEAQFMSTVTLAPIPSLWGHPAGAGASPADGKFLNDHISQFLSASNAANSALSAKTGWISDEACGAEHTKAGHADCVEKCWRGGTAVGHPEWKPQRVVFVADGDRRIWIVENPGSVRSWPAAHVQVSGRFNSQEQSVAIEQMAEIR